jgi:L-rhamnose mutarotase
MRLPQIRQFVRTQEVVMQRNAFVMKLKPGFEAEYKKRHDAIWPELSAELRRAGISDYSIFLDERTGYLFAVQKLAEGHTAERLPESPVVKKWWAYMKDIMDSHPDNSPVAVPLREVFHLE